MIANSSRNNRAKQLFSTGNCIILKEGRHIIVFQSLDRAKKWWRSVLLKTNWFIFQLVTSILLWKQRIRNKNGVSTAPRCFQVQVHGQKNPHIDNFWKNGIKKKLSIYIRTIRIPECENEVCIGSENNEKYYTSVKQTALRGWTWNRLVCCILFTS